MNSELRPIKLTRGWIFIPVYSGRESKERERESHRYLVAASTPTSIYRRITRTRRVVGNNSRVYFPSCCAHARVRSKVDAVFREFYIQSFAPNTYNFISQRNTNGSRDRRTYLLKRLLETCTFLDRLQSIFLIFPPTRNKKILSALFIVQRFFNL